MEKIFLSYAAGDLKTARKLVSDLRDRGINVWSETQLAARSSWEDVIGDEIRQAQAMVVLVSPASLNSNWPIGEWEMALRRSNRIIPVLINGASYWHLPTGLRDIEALNLNNYQLGLQKLVDQLREVVSSTDPLPAELLDIDQAVDEAVKRALERFAIEPRTTTPTAPEQSNSIFVVISFDQKMDPVFEAIKAAAQRVGLEAERIKDVQADLIISETILRKIEIARLVVVDLTDERPNVYFELGYARGKGKTVVTLLREGAKAHFDVQGWNYIPYIDSRPLEEDLVTRFRAEISAPEEGG